MSHVAIFAGKYDLTNREETERELRRLEFSNDLVLDFTEVTSVDFTFLAELVLLERARKAKGFAPVMVITPADAAVRRVFETTGFTTLLNLVENRRVRRPVVIPRPQLV